MWCTRLSIICSLVCITCIWLCIWCIGLFRTNETNVISVHGCQNDWVHGSVYPGSCSDCRPSCNCGTPDVRVCLPRSIRTYHHVSTPSCPYRIHSPLYTGRHTYAHAIWIQTQSVRLQTTICEFQKIYFIQIKHILNESVYWSCQRRFDEKGSRHV